MAAQFDIIYILNINNMSDNVQTYAEVAYAIRESTFTLGRFDLLDPDRSVSKDQALVTFRTDGGVRVKNKSTKVSMIVDGEVLPINSASMVIELGSTIEMGGSQFCLAQLPEFDSEGDIKTPAKIVRYRGPRILTYKNWVDFPEKDSLAYEYKGTDPDLIPKLREQLEAAKSRLQVASNNSGAWRTLGHNDVVSTERIIVTKLQADLDAATRDYQPPKLVFKEQ